MLEMFRPTRFVIGPFLSDKRAAGVKLLYNNYVNYSWIESTELATIRKCRRFLKLLPSHITAVMSHRGVIDRTPYEGNMFLHNCTKVLFSHVVQIHCSYPVVI